MQLGGNLISGCSCVDRFLLPSKRQDQSGSALRSRGITRRNYFSGLQAGSSEIGFMISSDAVSTWSRSAPGRVTSLFGLHLERESCIEVDSSEPADFDALEWVDNLNAFISEDNSWFYHQGEEKNVCGCTVDTGQKRVVRLSSKSEANYYAKFDDHDKCEVDPVATRSIGIGSGHGNQTTLEKGFESVSSITKKGANQNGN